MIDFASLRPTDNSPPAIAAALDRCLAVGQSVLATIKPLMTQRAALLLSGQPSTQPDENLAEIEEATKDALQVDRLIGELRQELDKVNATLEASVALAEMANWVAENSEILVQGMYLLGGLSRALTPQPPAPTPPAPPTNVVLMTPRPGAT